MVKNPRQILSHIQIYEAVCTGEADDINNAVQCVISSLRRKLRKCTDKEYIQTVWGIGYKFMVPEV